MARGQGAAGRQSIADGTLVCMPGDEDDETADGESIWFAITLGPQEQNTETRMCGPCKLVKGHYSVPLKWLNLETLTDEHAIFKEWPTEQDRIAVTHLMDLPDLKWEKSHEGGKFYMSRAQYDACNEQL